MNTEEEILKRLLRLFPVSILKSHFNIKAVSQEHVIRDIIQENTSSAIFHFANLHFESTKQHVYLFNFQKNISTDIQLPEKVKYDYFDSHNDKTYLTYFVPVKFTVLDIITTQKVDLTFLCPVRVHYNNKTKVLELKITILERQDKSLFQNRIVIISKTFDETSIVNYFINFLNTKEITLIPIDLNKGIKELWAKDIIDVPSVKYKKSKSTSTEIMDEEFTLKKDLPEIYAIIIKGPLEKTTCKFLSPDEYLPYFRVEPLNGFLAFSTYPTTLKSVNNVVDLILKHN